MLSAFRRRLGLKLFAAHLVVIVVGVVVLASATLLAAPSVFDHHMGSMMDGDMMGSTDEGESNLEIDFRAALREALVWAASTAFVAAIIVSLFVTRQVVRPVQAMMRASQRIAAGQYDERVEVTGNLARDELDELARLALSFNQMAAQIERTEEMRRRLIGDVAHELRTPLTTIKGTAEGLMDGVLAPEPEAFHQIYRKADRLQRLVQDLQELSRVEAGAYHLRPQPVGVERLVETTVERLKRQFDEKGVELGVSLSPDLPPVFADEDRAGQILFNLIGNALQYTPSGGRVLISAQPDHQKIVISIRDTGVGIAAEHLPHLFTRFYRVDKSRSRAGGGSGIGLTIARYLVQAHGGTLRAESPGLGQGSMFTFTLPAAPG
jgi:histidine kinase